jgi:hypothetical protein
MSARIDVGAIVAGLVFAGLGVAFLFDQLDLWELRSEVIWPAVLIALGAAIALGALFRRRPAPPSPAP